MRDSGNNAGEKAAIGCDIWTIAGDRTEPERVQTKLRPSAHRKYVANNSADAGGCALKRLDRARMIVTFHLEGDGPAVADVDHARVFLTGLDENVGPAGWKFFQFASRVFVGAMLAPHHRKDSELGEIRFATENFFDPLEFFRGQAVFRHQLRSYFRIGGRFGADHRQRTLTNVSPGSTVAFEVNAHFPPQNVEYPRPERCLIR